MLACRACVGRVAEGEVDMSDVSSFDLQMAKEFTGLHSRWVAQLELLAEVLKEVCRAD